MDVKTSPWKETNDVVNWKAISLNDLANSRAQATNGEEGANTITIYTAFPAYADFLMEHKTIYEKIAFIVIIIWK